MGTPNILTNSDVARELAQILGQSVETLDSMDGKNDGQINFHAISRGDRSKALKGRILPTQGIGYHAYENAFVIDNGDGKIGNGDLFLYTDGFYGESNQLAFRFAKLFEPRQTQTQSGYVARTSAQLPADAAKVLATVEKAKGRNFSDAVVKAAMKQVCS